MPEQKEMSKTSLSSTPGYPLELPVAAWNGAAFFAYTLLSLLLFKPEILPAKFVGAVYAVFQNHDTLVSVGLGAVAIHVGYGLFVLSISRTRKYGAKATAWWVGTAFALGFPSVKLFLDADK